jgi:predicted dehydrogenase
MDDSKFGVLILGAGWVSTQHIHAYANNPHTEIRGICDIAPENARRQIEKAGLTDVAVFDNGDDALELGGVDIVSVCTPQHVHCENVLAAAAKGKHIILEKPAANSLDELRQMRDAVRSAGVKTVVSFVLRWNPMFQEIKRRIADDQLGEIFCVQTDYQSYNSAWWGAWEQGRRQDLSVSAMAVAGCHAVDALRWFAAQGEFEAAVPVEVFAYAGGKRKGKTRQFNPIDCQWSEQSPMEYDGLEMILVKFDNGVLGKVAVNFEAIQPYTFPLEVFGDKGTIRDNRLFAPEGGAGEWIEIPGIRPDSSDVSHHPFQAQIDHFVDCIRNDVESHCNLEDAVKTHEVVFAALECYRQRRPIALPMLA